MYCTEIHTYLPSYRLRRVPSRHAFEDPNRRGPLSLSCRVLRCQSCETPPAPRRPRTPTEERVGCSPRADTSTPAAGERRAASGWHQPRQTAAREARAWSRVEIAPLVCVPPPSLSLSSSFVHYHPSLLFFSPPSHLAPLAVPPVFTSIRSFLAFCGRQSSDLPWFDSDNSRVRRALQPWRSPAP